MDPGSLSSSRYLRRLRRVDALRDGRQERAVVFRNRRKYVRRAKNAREEGNRWRTT